jgi:uncharacterized membrane protein
MNHTNSQIVEAVLLTFLTLFLLAGAVSYPVTGSSSSLFQSEINCNLLIIGLCIPLVAALLLIPVIRMHMRLVNDDSINNYSCDEIKNNDII